MKITGRILVVTAVLALAGCASSLNPLNWFRPAAEGAGAATDASGVPADGRELIARVTELRVERRPGGAIIRVAGDPPRIGYWDAKLVPENYDEPVDGVLRYTFRIAEPWEPTPTGTPHARRIWVAHFVSDAKLQRVTRIEVIGAGNSLSARR